MAGISSEKISKHVWDSYEYWAQEYLSRPPFEGTPVTGKMLRSAAEKIYKQYGVFVPIDLVLAQGQGETRFGTDASGRPNYKTNPFNVGETDAGTTKVFPDTAAGVDAYYDLMARRYLPGKTKEDLLTSFVNDKGQRYATDPDYEKKLGAQVNFIQSWGKQRYEDMKAKRGNNAISK